MYRKLQNRDPEFRAPEPDSSRETGNPLRDGYALVNRARQGFDGRYRMPSYAETDRPDYGRLTILNIMDDN